jgi:hypothetical protein
MFALDMDNKYFYAGQNGTWANGASIADIEAGSGANSTGPQLTESSYAPYIGKTPVIASASYTFTARINGGQDAFTYAVPTGFTAGI